MRARRAGGAGTAGGTDPRPAGKGPVRTHPLPKHVLSCINALLSEEERRIHYSLPTKSGENSQSLALHYAVIYLYHIP